MASRSKNNLARHLPVLSGGNIKSTAQTEPWVHVILLHCLATEKRNPDNFADLGRRILTSVA
ncbi:MAG: hypothetical protein U5M23_08625 [Marinagarivorans sp.]|nr:hypothetical protein [Marinagarivorans sp.]